MNGINAFFYFAIPAVLALAALWWLAFADGAHILARTLSQEHRHAEVVGAAVLPSKKMEIRISTKRDDPITLERAEIDGGDLWVYYRNATPARVGNIRYSWKLLAPDETVIKAKEGYPSIYSENGAPDVLDAGERGEMHLRIEIDPRAASIAIRMSPYF